MIQPKHNAADPKLVKKAEQDRKNARDQELDDIKEILKTPQGVRFFKRLMVEGKVFTTTFTGNSNTFFLEGHRNLALKFFSDITLAAPNKVAEIMLNEGRKE